MNPVRSHVSMILCALLILLPVVASARDNGYTIKYDGGSVTELKAGSDLRLYIDSNQIRFIWHKEEVLVIPATAITEISYGQDVHRRVGTAVAVGLFTLGVGSLAALSKSEKHFIGLTWANGDQKGGEYRGILAGIEGITGKKAFDSTTATAVAFGQTDSQKDVGGLSKANGEEQPFTIQGQTLGQTLQTYLQRIRVGGQGERELAKYEHTKNTQFSGDQALGACRDPRSDFARHFSKWCGKLIDAVDRGESFVTNLQFIFPCDFCDSLGVTIITGTFKDKLLVEIDAPLYHEYSEVLADVKARLGEPTDTTDVVSQNAYGATFHNPGAIWVRPSIVVSLISVTKWGSTGGYKSEVHVKARTADYDAIQRAKERENRIDTLK